VRKAPLPLREDYGWHSQIQKLINADAERARKQAASPYPSSWDAPIFGGTFERRRLKILNALFTCLTRSGMKPQLRGKEGRELSVTVGGTHVSFALDSINATKQLERERQGYGFMARGDKDKMRLTVSRWWKSEALLPSWQDEPRAPLERRLREIAAALIVFAEQTLRDAALSSHTYRIQRKAELEEAAASERRRRSAADASTRPSLNRRGWIICWGKRGRWSRRSRSAPMSAQSKHAAPKSVRLATFRHGGLGSRAGRPYRPHHLGPMEGPPRRTSDALVRSAFMKGQ
jgi:hypothetical protein